MTDEDIEAVARNLCLIEGDDPDMKVVRQNMATLYTPIGPVTVMPGEHAVIPLWRCYIHLAKIVLTSIENMRPRP